MAENTERTRTRRSHAQRLAALATTLENLADSDELNLTIPQRTTLFDAADVAKTFNATSKRDRWTTNNDGVS